MYDVFAEARRHAVQMREFFDAYIAEGFTEDQAMEMVKLILAGVVGMPPRR